MSSIMWGTSDFMGGKMSRRRPALAVYLGAQAFGFLADRPRDGFVEIRASWTPEQVGPTPVHDLMELHVEAWIELLRHATGLLPIAPGLSHMHAAQVHPAPVRTQA